MLQAKHCWFGADRTRLCLVAAGERGLQGTTLVKTLLVLMPCVAVYCRGFGRVKFEVAVRALDTLTLCPSRMKTNSYS